MLRAQFCKYQESVDIVWLDCKIGESFGSVNRPLVRVCVGVWSMGLWQFDRAEGQQFGV